MRTIGLILVTLLVVACSSREEEPETEGPRGGKFDVAGDAGMATGPVDCYRELLKDYVDSAMHKLHNEAVWEAAGVEYEMTPAVATEAVRMIGEELGCDPDDRALTVISPAECGAIGDFEGCYIETEAGYFMIAPDYVDAMNVIFHRWD